MKLLTLLLSLLLATTALRAQNPPARMSPYTDLYQPRTHADPSGQKLLYRLFQPSEILPGTKLPLILFLHGAGGRGSDNLGQLIDTRGNDATRFADPKYQAKYPCFILAPQCPAEKRWVNMDWSAPKGTQTPEPTDELRLAMAVLDTLQKDLPIDPDRIYITGLSMGGYGVWDALSRWPDRFAAAAPVCGGGDEQQAGRMKSIPIWAFHGGSDKTVPVIRSRNMVSALWKLGANPHYFEYPGVGHDSWIPAYNEEKLLPWLMAQKRGVPESAPAPAK